MSFQYPLLRSSAFLRPDPSGKVRKTNGFPCCAGIVSSCPDATTGYGYPAVLGVYSAVLHYLKAVEVLKSDADGRAVAAKMKETRTEDRLLGIGMVRADGRKIHDMYLREVKRPDESKYPGDFLKTRVTIPAAEAFRPLKEGGCPLVNG